MSKISLYLRVGGMRRSGNHAVINWMISQFSGQICFLNDLARYGFIRMRKSGSPPAMRLQGRKAVDLDSIGRKALVVTSYEDKPVSEVFDFKRIPNYSSYLGHTIEQFYHVIVLRDPFNMLASRLQKEANGGWASYRMRATESEGRSELLRHWKLYAKGFLEMENADHGFQIPMNYNRWVSDPEYRESVCEKLTGRPEEVSQLNKIPAPAGGSSFSKRKYISKQEFTRRWEKFRDHPALIEALEDQELHELSNEIFGKIVT